MKEKNDLTQNETKLTIWKFFFVYLGISVIGLWAESFAVFTLGTEPFSYVYFPLLKAILTSIIIVVYRELLVERKKELGGFSDAVILNAISKERTRLIIIIAAYIASNVILGSIYQEEILAFRNQ